MHRLALPFPVPTPVLAFGTETKNTLCFASGRSASFSRLHGDCSEYRQRVRFREAVRRWMQRGPHVLAADLHPGYSVSRYAQEVAARRRVALVRVQHHHAHIAAAMAESGLPNRRVIGIAFDGTGYGSDGTLWGGEFLICDYRSYIRAGHLETVVLPGGEAAIREPWRVALVWLQRLYGERLWRQGLSFLKGLPRKKARAVLALAASGFASPLSSSAGRLFDAAASIILCCRDSCAEAQLPRALEALARRSRNPPRLYPYRLRERAGCLEVALGGIVRGIVVDLKAKQSRADIAAALHYSVAHLAAAVCVRLRARTGINTVVAAGGVMHNTLVREHLGALLYKAGFCVRVHRRLPAGDASVSLGQAVIASCSPKSRFSSFQG